MEVNRELLSSCIEEDEFRTNPALRTTWYPEHVVKIENDNDTKEPGTQPDIHKVWIRTSNDSESNIKVEPEKLQKKSIKISLANSERKTKRKAKEQRKMSLSETVRKIKPKVGKFLWNSLELSISGSVSNKKLTFDQLQRNSTDLSNICLKVSEQWPKSVSHLKSISQLVVRKTTPAILFPCSFCAKMFKFKSSLTRHTLTHIGEETVKCDECQRSIRKGNFLRHMKAHKSEKYFECTECLKKFKHKTSLESHAKSHKTQGVCHLFTCEQCDKKYMHRTSLIKHIRRHQSNIPQNSKHFSCEQ